MMTVMDSVTDSFLAQIEQFRQFQCQLRDRWQSFDGLDQHDCDVLVVPSLTLDQRELKKIRGIHHYEERLLCSIMRLRNPRTRLIYVTSQPIHPSIIDYYLHLLPGIPFSHARDRLLLLSTYDASCRPLTEKILERPRLIDRIRQVIRPDRAYMTCFNSSPLERSLSVELGVPLLAVDPDLLYWGTKSGSRQIFAECGIPHPDGSLLTWTEADLTEAVADLWERQPDLQRIVIKLNEGFSGEGNALLDLRPIQAFAPGRVSRCDRVEAIARQFPLLSFQAAHETWENFSSRIPELGAIAEAFIEGAVKRSPSVQVSIAPDSQIEVLSTHDQILGGPDGQIFLGCRFPADETYRLQLQEWGRKIGHNLANKGALERLSIDFIAVQDQDATPDAPWQFYAIEINLRKGGTTHPFMALQLLTNGAYDCATGLFHSRQGVPKYYVASDNVESDRYRGLLPNDLMDIIAQHHLNFHSTTETGTVFHLMGCLSEFGKLGLTSIGNSPQHAEEIYQQTVQALDLETEIRRDRSKSGTVPSLHSRYWQ
jgi:hypothetical protein